MRINREDIPAIWGSVYEGIEQSNEASLGQAKPAEVLSALLSGHAVLFIEEPHVEGNPPSGVVAMTDEKEGRTNIVSGWVSPGEPKEVLENLINEVELDSFYLGVREVRFYSARPGAKRRIAPLGYKPRFVEFVKRIA